MGQTVPGAVQILPFVQSIPVALVLTLNPNGPLTQAVGLVIPLTAQGLDIGEQTVSRVALVAARAAPIAYFPKLIRPQVGVQFAQPVGRNHIGPFLFVRSVARVTQFPLAPFVGFAPSDTTKPRLVGVPFLSFKIDVEPQDLADGSKFRFPTLRNHPVIVAPGQGDPINALFVGQSNGTHPLHVAHARTKITAGVQSTQPRRVRTVPNRQSLVAPALIPPRNHRALSQQTQV